MPDEKEAEKREERAEREENEEERLKEVAAATRGAVAGAVEGTANVGARAVGAAGAAAHAVLKSTSGIGIMLILSLAFHAYDVFSGFTVPVARIIMYLVLGILGYATIFADWKYPAVLSLIAIGLPPLVLNVPFLAGLQILQFVILFLPAWPVYLLMFAPVKSKAYNIVRGVYVIFVVYFLVFQFGQPILSQFGIMQKLTVSQSQVVATQEFGTQIVKTVENLPTEIQGLWQQQIAVATGDLYTGQVEQNQQTPLGVYIDALRPADPVFYQGQKVGVWATIRARSIDQDVTITPSCKADNLIPGVPQLPNSQTSFTVVSLEQQDVECTFDSLKQGAHTIEMDAEFNFKTMSYIKGYFMDYNKLASFRRSGTDPLDQYKITDKTPVAVFTNGPVGIGMDLPQPMPIGIAADQIAPTFGISLNNQWQGKINKITKLLIYVPDGFSINVGDPGNLANTGDCDHKFDKYTPTGDEVQDGYNAYKLDDNDPAVKLIGNLPENAGYQTFKCRLTLDDANRIIGSTPINTLYFKSTVSYVYQTQKSIGINVRGNLTTTQ